MTCTSTEFSHKTGKVSNKKPLYMDNYKKRTVYAAGITIK